MILSGETFFSEGIILNDRVSIESEAIVVTNYAQRQAGVSTSPENTRSKPAFIV
jgi:hypothetical protein